MTQEIRQVKPSTDSIVNTSRPFVPSSQDMLQIRDG
jgi:hypothetical protein